jgi:glutamate carboxypeptidase
MPDTHTIQAYLEANLERYLDILRGMVEINSFTANPQGVNELGRFSAGLFEPWGFQAEYVQSVDASFGRHLFLSKMAAPTESRRQPRSIALVSHLDTVFPAEEEARNNFTWQRTDKRVYGPGTVDIKGGTLLIYMMLETIRKFEPQVFDENNWLVYLDASEEHLSEDFANLCLQRLPAGCEACLVFEGGSISDGDFLLVTARKGRATFRVNVEGRSAHAGNSHAQGANAIVQMAHTIQKIAALTDYSRDLTFNVGKVEGGVVINRVPHRAEALVEMRTFDPQVFTDGRRSILALDGVSEVSSQDGFSCAVRVEVLDESEPWPHNDATENLFDVWKEAAGSLGMSVRAEQRGGLSDGNYMWREVPVLDGLGPAGNNAHCSERDPDQGKEQEYAIIPSFVPKALMNVVAVLKLVQTPQAKPDRKPA